MKTNKLTYLLTQYATNKNDYEYYITVKNMHTILNNLTDVERKQLYYHYALMGVLEFEKVNKKSIVINDITENKTRLHLNDNYKFYLNSFNISNLEKTAQKIKHVTNKRKAQQQKIAHQSKIVNVEFLAPNGKTIFKKSTMYNKHLGNASRKLNYKIIKLHEV